MDLGWMTVGDIPIRMRRAALPSDLYACPTLLWGISMARSVGGMTLQAHGRLGHVRWGMLFRLCAVAAAARKCGHPTKSLREFTQWRSEHASHSGSVSHPHGWSVLGGHPTLPALCA